MANLNYKQWALACFKSWETLPDRSLEWDEKAKRLRAKYLAIAQVTIFLCQPPREDDREESNLLTADEFIERYDALALDISDILALLKDSADWAIASIDPDAPHLPLHYLEVQRLQGFWELTWESNSPGLQMPYRSLYNRIKSDCQINRRMRMALIRLEWAFSETDELIGILKSHGIDRYVRGLKNDGFDKLTDR